MYVLTSPRVLLFSTSYKLPIVHIILGMTMHWEGQTGLGTKNPNRNGGKIREWVRRSFETWLKRCSGPAWEQRAPIWSLEQPRSSPPPAFPTDHIMAAFWTMTTGGRSLVAMRRATIKGDA